MKGIESPFGLLTDEEDIRIYERQQEEESYYKAMEKQMEEDYYRQLEEEYYKDMEEEYNRQMQESHQL